MYQRTEQEIMGNWKSDTDIPIVSICCTAYNHEAYIAEAIEGFLMQETDFPFEILIRDDCSTDKTADIVKNYADSYPQLIKPVYEKENTYSKGVRPMPVVVKRAIGKYIAFCEGDDYWTDPFKLQKQINLLKVHPKSMMSVAYTDMYEQDNESLKYLRTLNGNDKSLQGFEEIKKYYFHTSTYVIKTDILKSIFKDLTINNIRYTDTTLRFILITYGPFVLLPEVVSVYRQTGDGIWTSLNESKKWQWDVSMSQDLIKILPRKYKNYQGELLYSLYQTEIKKRIKTGHLIKGISRFPFILYYGVFYKVPAKLTRKLSKYRASE